MDNRTRGQFCTFMVDDQFFGIEVLAVQEVLRAQRMTPVPLAPAEVHGLINLRGQIVTAIDLRTRLGVSSRPDGLPPMNVVVRTDAGPVSLLVDEIDDVVEPPADAWEPAPDTLSGAVRGLVRGVYKLDGRLLLVLDMAAAVDVAAA